MRDSCDADDGYMSMVLPEAELINSVPNDWRSLVTGPVGKQDTCTDISLHLSRAAVGSRADLEPILSLILTIFAGPLERGYVYACAPVFALPSKYNSHHANRFLAL